jgi:glutamyl-tRNA reductase
MSKNNFEIINARITFKNVPIHKIEKFSFKNVATASEAFKKISDVMECVILQNAFRVEVFLVINLEQGEVPDRRRSEGKPFTINQIQETWESLSELEEHDLDHFDQTLEVYKDADVIHHLLRLVSGLDSIIIGRKEILDEIKDAVSSAKQAGVVGKILEKLFDSCIRIATRVRESSEISEGLVSIGDIAVKTAEDKTGIDKKHVLLIGTGETAAMVAKALNKKKHAFDVTSRIIERATSFSKLLGGTPLKFEDVLAGFDKFDIIFVATTADYFFINYDILRIVMENKKKGTLLIDVSDPRAVDEKVSKFPGMKLMFRDQISELVEENEQTRMNKIPDVEKMISKEVPIIEALMKRLDPELIA